MILVVLTEVLVASLQVSQLGQETTLRSSGDQLSSLRPGRCAAAVEAYDAVATRFGNALKPDLRRSAIEAADRAGALRRGETRGW